MKFFMHGFRRMKRRVDTVFCGEMCLAMITGGRDSAELSNLQQGNPYQMRSRNESVLAANLVTLMIRETPLCQYSYEGNMKQHSSNELLGRTDSQDISN